jgi:hypothetical protein
MASMDVAAYNHGSLWALHPLTPAAQDWMALHIAEDAQWMGNSLMVEARYVEPILEGMAADGLVVQ